MQFNTVFCKTGVIPKKFLNMGGGRKKQVAATIMFIAQLLLLSYRQVDIAFFFVHLTVLAYKNLLKKKTNNFKNISIDSPNNKGIY